jgi:O-antigen/teichoic acid export membrane protein
MSDSDKHIKQHLTGGKLLARNTIFNFLGQAGPLIVGIVATPILIYGLDNSLIQVEGLGDKRFGVLILAWMVIGYFSIFDLGLGRALTKLVAEKLGDGKDDEVPALIWTGLSLMTLLGLLGALVVLCISRLLVYSVLNVDEFLQLETLYSFYILGLSLPVVIITVGARGVLEAQQRFGLTSCVRTVRGVFNFAGPVVLLLFTNKMHFMVALLAIGNLLSMVVYIWLCFTTIPALRKGIVFSRKALSSLFVFGGWISISNIIGPLVSNIADRFLIGVLITMEALTYYSTPFDAVCKLFILPTAIIGVLFPAFSAGFLREPERMARLLERGTKYILLGMFPAVLILVALARQVLTIWLSPDFADQSTLVLQLLAIGVLINSLAQTPYAMIQGAGKPKLTAILQVAEAPFYLILLWWMMINYGIKGVAAAWLIRTVVDAVILLWMARRVLPGNCASVINRIAIAQTAATAALLLSIIPTSTINCVFTLLTVMLLFGWMAWFRILDDEERIYAMSFIRRIAG